MVAEVTPPIPLASLQMSFSATETLFGPRFIIFFQSTERSAANIYFSTSCWVFSLMISGFPLGKWKKA